MTPDKTHTDSTNGLESDVAGYLRERERVRRALGGLGGIPQRRQRIFNIIFFVLVLIAFGISLFLQDPRNIPLEVAILLVSLKLMFLLREIARMNHFQFWMLSTLEWRLNDMASQMKKIEKATTEKPNAQEKEG